MSNPPIINTPRGTAGDGAAAADTRPLDLPSLTHTAQGITDGVRMATLLAGNGTFDLGSFIRGKTAELIGQGLTPRQIESYVGGLTEGFNQVNGNHGQGAQGTGADGRRALGGGGRAAADGMGLGVQEPRGSGAGAGLGSTEALHQDAVLQPLADADGPGDVSGDQFGAAVTNLVQQARQGRLPAVAAFIDNVEDPVLAQALRASVFTSIQQNEDPNATASRAHDALYAAPRLPKAIDLAARAFVAYQAKSDGTGDNGAESTEAFAKLGRAYEMASKLGLTYAQFHKALHDRMPAAYAEETGADPKHPGPGARQAQRALDGYLASQTNLDALVSQSVAQRRPEARRDGAQFGADFEAWRGAAKAASGSVDPLADRDEDADTGDSKGA